MIKVLHFTWCLTNLEDGSYSLPQSKNVIAFFNFSIKGSVIFMIMNRSGCEQIYFAFEILYLSLIVR